MPTSNRGYETPATGTLPGTWGSAALNPNFAKIDSNLGAISVVPLSNASVVLNSAQYDCGTVRLTGTLSADVTVTFPAVSGWWSIKNDTAPTAALYVVRIAVAGGSVAIGLPWGKVTDILTDGTGVYFRNIGDVGTDYYYSGSVAPRWLSYCTNPPLLVQDGSTFSSSAYPVLFAILGTTTLPDARGRLRANLNGGSGRITTAGSGIDGNTRFSGGGAQNVVLDASTIPANIPNSAVSVSGFAGGVGYVGTNAVNIQQGNSGSFLVPDNSFSASIGTSTTVTINPGGGAPHTNMPPTYIGGITMIWAA